ncbi:MAG: hypothetical protein OXP73_00830 [Chloroflexota bacterium]|nr:hypothetical protein [Chloroflexota bacterium]
MRPRIRTLVAAVAAVVLLTVVTVSAVLAHGGFGRGGGKAGAATAIEEQTGLSQEELRTRLQGGESLADIIEAEGGDLEAVVTAALTDLDEKVTALVEAGRLQSDQVEDYKANAEQRVRDWLAGTYEGKRGKGRGHFGGKGRGRIGGTSHGLIAIVSEQTGVSVEDIRAKLAEELSLADVVEEADGDLTAITDAAMEAYETRLTAAIENGRVSADGADELRRDMRERIDAALQADGGPGCKGHGKSGSRGWGRGHGRDAAGAKSGFGKVTLPLGETPSTA